MKKRLFIISFSILCLTLFAPTQVIAQQTTLTPTPTSTTQQKCQIITARISAMITNANKRLQQRQSGASTRAAAIQKSIQNLQAKGVDVSKLQADLTQLTTLLNQSVTDFQLYITKLQATQNFTCGDAQGQFKQALIAARTQLQVVRQDNKTIMQFITGTLMKDLQVLRPSTGAARGNRGVGSGSAFPRGFRQNRFGSGTPGATNSPVPTQ